MDRDLLPTTGDLPTTAAVPLSYENPSTSAWHALFTITRGVTFFVIFRQSLGIAQYTVGVACYFWNAATAPPQLRMLVPGPIYLFELPDILAALAALVAAFGCLHFSETSRRAVVRASTIQLFTAPATLIATAIYYQSSRNFSHYGMAYEAHTLIRYLMAAIFITGISFATIKFFQHPSVRRSFDSSKSNGPLTAIS